MINYTVFTIISSYTMYHCCSGFTILTHRNESMASYSYKKNYILCSTKKENIQDSEGTWTNLLLLEL